MHGGQATPSLVVIATQ